MVAVKFEILRISHLSTVSLTVIPFHNDVGDHSCSESRDLTLAFSSNFCFPAINGGGLTCHDTSHARMIMTLTSFMRNIRR